jgi:hypothetical protein
MSLSSAPHTGVEVQLNININAKGDVEVFGEGKPDVVEYIIAKKELPVSALYAAGASGAPDSGLIEFWEPSDALGDIKCRLAGSDAAHTEVPADAYKTASAAMVAGLQALLEEEFDCVNAAPFSGYVGEEEYTKQDDFGRVALAAYAHSLFGHVDATAAITNDEAFVTGMLATRSTAATDPMTWDDAADGTNANLAIRLVQAILAKGVASGVYSESNVNAITDINSDATLANVVRQVLGQDPNRAINADNSQRTVDKHMVLRFYEGDIIFVSITLQAPTVNIGGSYAGPLTGTGIAGRFNADKKYNVKIRLGAGTQY